MRNNRFSRCLLLLICLGVAGALAQTAAPPMELTIQGDVAAPVTLTAKDLAAMPHETASVTEQDGSKVSYQGVALRAVLERAGVPLGKELRGKALASYIVAKARDGYEVVFSLGELSTSFGNEQILLADQRDGKPLFEYQGPLRLVCPDDKAGARSVRMLTTIEVVRLLK